MNEPRPAPEDIGHDHRLAAVYFASATLVLSVYGVRVCPFVADLHPWTVVTSFAFGFGLAMLFKLLFEERLMPVGDPFRLSIQQFLIDLGLYVAVGVGIGLWHTFAHGFPIESGLKILIGCIMFGLFASLDNGLRRERRSPPALQVTTPPARIFPIADRLLAIFSSIAVCSGLVLGLVIIKDVDYLILNADQHSQAELRRAVFIDIAFIVGVVLVLSLRLLYAYGQHLAYMLQLQIQALDEVSADRLDHFVPIITRDEFSLIACKTNQMIATLRRAHDEQRELFELNQALVTELQPDRLLTRIVATTRAFVDAERVSLFLYDPATDELWGKVAEGVDSELRFPASHGIVGHVFRSGEALIIADAYADPRFNRDSDLATGYQTRNLMCVAVYDREGHALGVLQALNSSHGFFDADDQRRLESCAAQAAIALVNAQLFADLDRSRRYSESILQSLSNGVVTLNLGGEVVKLNQAAERILGHDQSLIGCPFASVLPEHAQWWRRLRESNEQIYLADTDLELLDGSRRSLNLSRVPLTDLEERPIGSLLVFEDLTEGKRVRDTLSRYLPSQVAEQVLADSANQLGGVSQVATVLFSDIREFTTISERIGARATVTMLNRYFSTMVEAINTHGGILDKYIGDAIMAVFGVPFAGEHDPDCALRAALDMIQRLSELNRERQFEGLHPIDIGIGLSTGELIAGNIGAPRRMDYTVIGDTVNLAARLESATKGYGVRLLISGQTRHALKDDYPIRELDQIRVKGKLEAAAVYQVFGHDELPVEGLLDAFAEGRRHYLERDWARAHACFEAVIHLAADDGPSAIYLQRCQLFQQQPPPVSWDGVWPATG